MRYFYKLLIGLFLSIYLNNTYSQEKINWRAAGKYFENQVINSLNENNVDISLKYIDSVAFCYKENDPKLYYISLQNKAFILEERKQNIIEAITLADSCFKFWSSIFDFNNKANISKYLGYLYSNIGEYELSKQYIDTAYFYFNMVNNQNGILVTKFDEAILNYNKKEYERSLKLLFELKADWKLRNDLQRVFFVNIKIIKNYLFFKPEDKSTINILLNENKELIRNNEVKINNEFIILLSEIENDSHHINYK